MGILVKHEWVDKIKKVGNLKRIINWIINYLNRKYKTKNNDNNT